MVSGGVRKEKNRKETIDQWNNMDDDGSESKNVLVTHPETLGGAFKLSIRRKQRGKTSEKWQNTVCIASQTDWATRNQNMRILHMLKYCKNTVTMKYTNKMRRFIHQIKRVLDHLDKVSQVSALISALVSSLHYLYNRSLDCRFKGFIAAAEFGRCNLVYNSFRTNDQIKHTCILEPILGGGHAMASKGPTLYLNQTCRDEASWNVMSAMTWWSHDSDAECTVSFEYEW